MPSNYDVTPTDFSVGNALSAYRQGATNAEAQSQNFLQHQVGATAATQGLLPASQAAMMGGDVQGGINLQNMDIERQSKLFDIMSRGAIAADTPQKWQQFGDYLEQHFGQGSMGAFRDFNSRDTAISLALTAKDRLEAAGKLAEANKYGKVGVDAMGQDIYGYPPAPPPGSPAATLGSMVGGQSVNPGQTIPPVGSQPAGISGQVTQADLMDENGTPLTGQPLLDRLKAKSPELGETIQAMGEGRALTPQRAKNFTQLTGLTQMAFPGFDATTYASRLRMRESLADTSPNSMGGQRQAMNVALEHLGKLSDAVNDLGNSTYFPTAINTAKNFYSKEISGSARTTKFDAAVTPVIDELSKVYTANGATDSQVSAWRLSLVNTRSPEQLHTALGEMASLLRGKLNAMDSSWAQTMGPHVPPEPMLFKPAQEALAKVDARATGAPEPTTAPAGMAKVTSDTDYNALPSGTTFIGPDGQPRRKP